MRQRTVFLTVIGFLLLPTGVFAFQPLFDTWLAYDVGSIQKGIFAADVDGSGGLDLLVADYGTNTVSVLLNNGDKTFAPKVNYATGTRPDAVFAADLDGDGDQDLAVVNYGSRTVSILKNNGNGTFAVKVDYPTGNGPKSIYIADLDGDGDRDLAVANDSSNTVSILKNNGNATFAAKVDYAAGTNPASVFGANLDGDGDIDLAVANAGSDNVSILLNNGDGTFAAKVDYSSPGNPFSIYAADLDGDGDRDLAVASGFVSGSGFRIFKNNGNGTFAAGVGYSVPTGGGGGLSSVVLTDVDGDGDQDLVVANPATSMVHVGKNDGTGTFFSGPTIWADYPSGPGPLALFAADLDGDTYPDLAAANGGTNSISVHRNDGNGAFDRRQDINVGSGGHSVYAADLDGDLDRDLAVESGYGFAIYKNGGDGTFGSGAFYGAGGAFTSDLFAADFDGDGDQDVAVTGSSINFPYTYFVSIWKNNGDGTFAGRVDYTTGSGPQTVFAADLDGDGDRDLVTANLEDNKISVLKNNGDGTFAAKVDYATGFSPYYVFAADLDGDGDQDVAICLQYGDAVSVLKNNGDGTFGIHAEYGTGTSSGAFSVYAADLDGDGDRDLVTANQTVDKVSILKNNGDGTFALHVDYPTGKSPTVAVAADLDGDGKQDIAVTNQLDNTVSVLKNNGNGTFATKVDYGTNLLPWGLAAADLDGDGDQDLVGTVGSVLKNLSTVVSNTSVGRSVVVNLPNGVTMSYDSIGAAGNTTVATSSTGPAPNTGFQILPLASPLYYDFTTTAAFVGPVTICFAYNPAGLTPLQEAQLKVEHFVLGAWVDVTQSLDTASNRICARVTSLSPFALMAPTNPTGVTREEIAGIPTKFTLAQNFPNPFNASTQIVFDLPGAGNRPVKLEVIDILGQRIATLIDQALEGGRYHITWDGKDGQGKPVASGVYFYRLQAGEFRETKRMTLLK